HDRLYRHLREVAARGQITYYKDVAAIVGLDMANPHERDQMSVLLDDISISEHDEGRPLLSAVVIHRQDNIPGNGFFTMATRVGEYDGGDRFTFFMVELRRVHDYWR